MDYILGLLSSLCKVGSMWFGPTRKTDRSSYKNCQEPKVSMQLDGPKAPCSLMVYTWAPQRSEWGLCIGHEATGSLWATGWTSGHLA